MNLLGPLRAELFRVLRTRATLTLLLLPALAGALRILAAHVAARSQFSRDALAGAVAPAGNGFGPLADGLRTGATVLALVLLVAGALALVRERESGALGLAFLGVRRGTWVMAKALSLLSVMLGGFALLFATCAALAGALHGLGPIVDEGYEIASAAQLWGEVGRACLPSLSGLAATAWFGLAISACASSSGAAVACTLVPVVLVDVLKEMHHGLAQYLFVTYAPLLGDGSPLARLPDMARSYADAMWRDGELARAAWVPALWCGVLVLLAIWVTRRRPA